MQEDIDGKVVYIILLMIFIIHLSLSEGFFHCELAGH